MVLVDRNFLRNLQFNGEAISLLLRSTLCPCSIGAHTRVCVRAFMLCIDCAYPNHSHDNDVSAIPFRSLEIRIWRAIDIRVCRLANAVTRARTHTQTHASSEQWTKMCVFHTQRRHTQRTYDSRIVFGVL